MTREIPHQTGFVKFLQQWHHRLKDLESVNTVQLTYYIFIFCVTWIMCFSLNNEVIKWGHLTIIKQQVFLLQVKCSQYWVILSYPETFFLKKFCYFWDIVTNLWYMKLPDENKRWVISDSGQVLQHVDILPARMNTALSAGICKVKDLKTIMPRFGLNMC